MIFTNLLWTCSNGNGSVSGKDKQFIALCLSNILITISHDIQILYVLNYWHTVQFIQTLDIHDIQIYYQSLMTKIQYSPFIIADYGVHTFQNNMPNLIQFSYASSMHLISQDITHCPFLYFTGLLKFELLPSGLANYKLYFKIRKFGCQITCWYTARRKRKSNLMPQKAEEENLRSYLRHLYRSREPTEDRSKTCPHSMKLKETK